jgi:hypothetical protein
MLASYNPACHKLNITGFAANTEFNDANGLYGLFTDIPYQDQDRCGYNPLYVRQTDSFLYALLTLRATITNVQFWTIARFKRREGESLIDTLRVVDREVVFVLAAPNGLSLFNSLLFRNSIYAVSLGAQFISEVWDVQELNGNRNKGILINPSFDVIFSCRLFAILSLFRSSL